MSVAPRIDQFTEKGYKNVRMISHSESTTTDRRWGWRACEGGTGERVAL